MFIKKPETYHDMSPRKLALAALALWKRLDPELWRNDHAKSPLRTKKDMGKDRVGARKTATAAGKADLDTKRY